MPNKTNSVEQYLVQKKFPYKPVSSGEQYCVKDCPVCGDDSWHFFISRDKGLWDCKKCLRHGNLYTLKKDLGDLSKVESVSSLLGETAEEDITIPDELVLGYYDALMQDDKTLKWLLDRGISIESIRKFRLGLKKEGSREWLTMPYFRGGATVNIKSRALPPMDKKFTLVTGHSKPLFNADALKGQKKVYITEGELDAIVLSQNGYYPVVSVPTGANSFSAISYDELASMEKIYLLYDMDVAGRAGAREAIKRLDAGRCYNIKLPTNDVTDFFMKYGQPELEAIIEETPLAGKLTIMPPLQAFDWLIEDRTVGEGISTSFDLPWPKLNRLVRGMDAGNLLMILAPASMGKTAFTLNIVYELAKKSVPCFFYCLEMSVPELLSRVVSNHRNVSEKDIRLEDIILTKGAMYNWPLYFAGVGSVNTLEIVMDNIRQAVQRYGVKVVVFDHLHFLCHSADNITAEVGMAAQSFKLLAAELGIVIIVIVQPRKVSLTSKLTMFDARDSGLLASICDTMLGIYRKPVGTSKTVSEEDYDGTQQTFESRTLIQILKARRSSGGSTVLYFNGDFMRFEECE